MINDFKIRTLNPEVSGLTQELLFKVGGSWEYSYDGPTEVQHTDKPFLYYYGSSDKRIVQGISEYFFRQYLFRELIIEELVEEIENELNLIR